MLLLKLSIPGNWGISLFSNKSLLKSLLKKSTGLFSTGCSNFGAGVSSSNPGSITSSEFCSWTFEDTWLFKSNRFISLSSVSGNVTASGSTVSSDSTIFLGLPLPFFTFASSIAISSGVFSFLGLPRPFFTGWTGSVWLLSSFSGIIFVSCPNCWSFKFVLPCCNVIGCTYSCSIDLGSTYSCTGLFWIFGWTSSGSSSNNDEKASLLCSILGIVLLFRSTLGIVEFIEFNLSCFAVVYAFFTFCIFIADGITTGFVSFAFCNSLSISSILFTFLLSIFFVVIFFPAFPLAATWFFTLPIITCWYFGHLSSRTALTFSGKYFVINLSWVSVYCSAISSKLFTYKSSFFPSFL